jgi:hypothetical protein
MRFRSHTGPGNPGHLRADFWVQFPGAEHHFRPTLHPDQRPEGLRQGFTCFRKPILENRHAGPGASQQSRPTMSASGHSRTHAHGVVRTPRRRKRAKIAMDNIRLVCAWGVTSELVQCPSPCPFWPRPRTPRVYRPVRHVWGIMILHTIGLQQSAALAGRGPGISAAPGATAIGLGVDIPAPSATTAFWATCSPSNGNWSISPAPF